MHYSRKSGYSLTKKYDYDNLVFCRYDLFIDDSLVLDWGSFDGVETSVSGSWGAISDIFGVMPYRYAEDFFLYDKIERLHSSKFDEKFKKHLEEKLHYLDDEKWFHIHDNTRYCPHLLLVRSLQEKDIDWRLQDYPVFLLR